MSAVIETSAVALKVERLALRPGDCIILTLDRPRQRYATAMVRWIGGRLVARTEAGEEFPLDEPIHPDVLDVGIGNHDARDGHWRGTTRSRR